MGLAHPSIAPYGGFTTGDGDILLISIQSDREWVDLCTDVLDRPELGSAPRLRHQRRPRIANRHATDGTVAEVFGGLNRAEVERRLQSGRIAYGAVNDVAALSAHPQLRRVSVRHETGEVALPAPPVATDWESMGVIPALGKHSDALRAEFAPS